MKDSQRQQKPVVQGVQTLHINWLTNFTHKLFPNVSIARETLGVFNLQETWVYFLIFLRMKD